MRRALKESTLSAPAPFTKEQPYVLSVDPASNACGVSLWKDGTFIDSALLSSRSPRDLFSIRLQTIALQLETFLSKNLKDDEKVTVVVCEGVRSVLVQICIGALLCSKYIEAPIKTGSFIHSTSWKKYAKDRGATGPLKDIKGMKALKEIGWAGRDVSDDEADAILIYYTWRNRAKLP